MGQNVLNQSDCRMLLIDGTNGFFEGQTGPGQTTIELEGKECREEPVVEDENKENVQMKEKIVIEID